MKKTTTIFSIGIILYSALSIREFNDVYWNVYYSSVRLKELKWFIMNFNSLTYLFYRMIFKIFVDFRYYMPQSANNTNFNELNVYVILIK